jgi:5-methyltetrahydropteroyltriglutamate--homocysteine methyltransferase
VVLGRVSTKTPELETEISLRRRIDEAGRFVPLENLALSPAVRVRQPRPGHRPDIL